MLLMFHLQSRAKQKEDESLPDDSTVAPGCWCVRLRLMSDCVIMKPFSSGENRPEFVLIRYTPLDVTVPFYILKPITALL